MYCHLQRCLWLVPKRAPFFLSVVLPIKQNGHFTGLINGKGVCAALTNGRTIKVTVDNIDGRIKANQVFQLTRKEN